ncbi:MAG: DEAD/DEAH box helicase, partial [Dehalococcoidales bacterium]|nr:DEAD/DEAH box helicase [Dehalococcoidales bacterium]
MGYAEVSVNSPIARRQSFSYAIPPGLSVAVGQAVLVPFGAKVLQGIVVALTEFPAVEETREISGLIDTMPLLTPVQVAWAHWLSEYYLAPLWDCVALMLPPGFERRVLTFFSLATGRNYDKSELTPDQLKLIEIIEKDAKVGLKELAKQLGQRKARNITNHLVDRSFIVRNCEFEPVRVKPKLVTYISLSVSPPEAFSEVARLNKRAAKQAELLELLANSNQPLPLAAVRKTTGITAAALIKLIERKLVEIKEIEVRREPLANQQLALSLSLALTGDQQSALNTIKTSLQAGKPDVFLLHGVTGSGKTEVYLQALAETVKQGKRGIVLVPEISLTPQTIERFAARFPNRVAVLHSQLSLGEQFDEWQRIRRGEFDVVIGPRSALFAPQPDLGLMVIDEEHEWNYKQTENSPRYHARDAAIKLSGLSGATVVLGSATPDVESYYHALNGDYKLL